MGTYKTNVSAAAVSSSAALDLKQSKEFHSHGVRKHRAWTNKPQHLEKGQGLAMPQLLQNTHLCVLDLIPGQVKAKPWQLSPE